MSFIADAWDGINARDIGGGTAVKLTDNHYFSPIGIGEKIHIFHKQSDVLNALCFKGPGYTVWHEAPDDEVCKNCLRKYRKTRICHVCGVDRDREKHKDFCSVGG